MYRLGILKNFMRRLEVFSSFLLHTLISNNIFISVRTGKSTVFKEGRKVVLVWMTSIVTGKGSMDV